MSIIYNNLENWINSPARGHTYSFLSSCFRDEPNPEIISTFLKKRETLITCLDELEQQDKKEIQKIIDSLQHNWDNPNEEQILQMRKEFAYLFLTRDGVKPFESVYRGKKKLLMDQPWEEVRNFYRKVGLEKSPEEDHPEDHAAVELGFMANFAFITEETLAEKEDISELVNIQSEFLQNHLSRWIPELCEDILKKREKIQFYQLPSRLTQLFLELDHFFLNELQRRD